MNLPELYHWSPVTNRKKIRSEGLRPYSPSCVSGPISTPTEGGDWRECGTLRFPYVCLGTSAKIAWTYSGGMQYDYLNEIEDWDLWQVTLATGDEVQYRGGFSPVLEEIRVYSVIPADRVWHVGTRELPYAEEEKAPGS